MLTDLQKRKLTKLFAMYDTRCDGYLLAEDYENMAKKIAASRNLGLRSIKCQTLMSQFTYDWKCLQKKADGTHDQKVSLKQWLEYHDEILGDRSKYDEQIRARTVALLDAFDRDENGGLSQQEWAELLKVYNVSPVYADIVYPALDTNQDGFLTKDEILQLIDDFYYSDDPNAPANMMFGPY